ncbi:MAG: hypothetical protein ACI3XQ_09035, partial [Eubacteriales bacterium]
MKKLLRFFATITAFVMLLGSLVTLSACKKNKGDEQTTNSVSSNSSESDLTALEVKDFGGAEFKMLWPEVHADGHFLHNELAVKEYSSNLIDSAVYERNQNVTMTYNCSISVDLQFCSTIPKTVRIEGTAGDSSYDAVATNLHFMSPIAYENHLADFGTFEYYDEGQEWWNHRLMGDFAIANQKFFASGDIIYSDDFYPYCIFANTNLAMDVGINDNFYDLVREKEWTLEQLHEYAVIGRGELDGDGAHTVNDRHGAVVNSNFAKAVYYSSGRGMIYLDSAGYPTWAMERDHAQSVLEKLIKAWHDDDAFWESKTGQISGLNHAQTELRLFNESKALFLAEELIISERIRKSENALQDFAILPMPLYEKGGEYISMLNDAVVISVPQMCDGKENISLFLSAMGRASVNTLTPAFFEKVLSHQYMNNPDSLEMLEIILSTTVPLDVATIN